MPPAGSEKKQYASRTKICVCKICTCGTHNCPKWPVWPKNDPFKKVLPFNEGFKTGISEFMEKYTPKPIHPPPVDPPKVFRHAHEPETTYMHHYTKKYVPPPPIMQPWPTKTLFRGESTYTYDYKTPPRCPICPCPPYLTKSTSRAILCTSKALPARTRDSK